MKVIQANRIYRPLLLGLVLFAALAAISALWPNHTSTVEAAAPSCDDFSAGHPGPCRALIDAATVSGSPSVEEQIAAAEGFVVTVKPDTGGGPGASWATMSAADFGGYELLIVGDPFCGVLPPGLISSRTVWGPVVLGTAGGRTLAGNRIAAGIDVVLHGGTLVSPRGEIIRDGISYAGQQPNRTGMYLDTTCAANYSGQSVETLQLLNALTAFPVPVWTIDASPPCGGSVSLIASVLPAFAALTTASLQGWGCSVHESFPTFPSEWSALAVATDTTLHPTCGHDPADPPAAADHCGEAYILLAGSSIVLTSGSISLSPLDATNPVGSNHTVTAHVTSGGSPVAGQVVTFSITSGPNTGASGTCVPAGCVTDASGNVSFTYHDGGGAGDDTIKASFTDATGSLQSATAQKHWVGANPSAIGGLVALPTAGSGTDVPWMILIATAGGALALLAAGLWYGRRRSLS